MSSGPLYGKVIGASDASFDNLRPMQVNNEGQGVWTPSPGDDEYNDVKTVAQKCVSITFAGSAYIKQNAGLFYGYRVEDAAGLSFALFDGGSSGLRVHGKAAGVSVVEGDQWGVPAGAAMEFFNGLYFLIMGGTGEVTFFYR